MKNLWIQCWVDICRAHFEQGKHKINGRTSNEQAAQNERDLCFAGVWPLEDFQPPYMMCNSHTTQRHAPMSTKCLHSLGQTELTDLELTHQAFNIDCEGQKHLDWIHSARGLVHLWIVPLCGIRQSRLHGTSANNDTKAAQERPAYQRKTLRTTTTRCFLATEK